MTNYQNAGIDEAGRGCLAGPVYAATVMCDEAILRDSGVRDSKKLTAKRREMLYGFITENAVEWSVARIEPDEIDRINILQASMKAMRISVENFRQQPAKLLVDGNYFIGFGIPYETIIKGDDKIPLIGAASILAKVSRDRYMCDIADVLYPEYGFARHKGYGTRLHYEALKKHGPCPIHRHTFLKKLFQSENSLFG